MALQQAIASTSERTPLLSRSGDTTSTSSLSVSSSDVSSEASVEGRRSLCNEPLLDEEARLEFKPETPLASTSASVGHIVCVLLIGTFISNADSSLLFATHTIIASEFNALHDSSWLLTSFALAQAATLPLYGKLSDIYGRKSLLLLAYTLFAAGCFFVGIGGSMSELIIGRIVSGLGASGMTALVSILITDLVPLRDVATWRSWVNIVATTGRSIGGPLGGWLADSVGWRWSFLGQVPFAGVAIVLVWITLPAHIHHQLDEETKGSRFGRIDFLGATLMTLSILCLLLPMEIGGDRIPWSDHRIFMLFAAALIFGGLFLAVEGWVAKEPIIPLSVLHHKEVLLSSLIMMCQVGAQVGLMFAVPLYFQVTAKASSTVAGAHLFPAVFGNAIGGLISGAIIKRTGRYKALTLVATGVASLAYMLLILRWHGNTNWLESLYIFPGGFGTGIASSTLFISIQAALDPSLAAIAASTLYLASSIGMLGGMAGVSAVLQQSLRINLNERLTHLGIMDQKKWKIIEKAVSDVHYINKVKPDIANAIIGSYIGALTWTHVVSLACALTGFIATIFLRQHKL
ncbi:major facilitator superfamily domain-containing protein [Boeremia exigua]|uniref:major facilitator superfamily domain-containing protein n=1 Tax=Boeremia exigua TaxID=749465 RepID=UPI001E8E18C3|nr:major facilitator superfamily domain-containing protein [Boeremia exigua]KAH6622024.1 major facilitator superfamily domain-containing protein [Boeremia exigua]